MDLQGEKDNDEDGFTRRGRPRRRWLHKKRKSGKKMTPQVEEDQEGDGSIRRGRSRRR